MDTDKILKQYENALAKYHADLPAHKKAMKKYLKKKKKFDKKALTLLTVNLHINEPYCDGGTKTFFITEQGLEELEKLVDKVEVEFEYPHKPEELFKPTLEVITETTVVPF